VQRGAPDRHAARDDPGRALVLDEVAGPRVLAVLEHALAVELAVLEVEVALAGLDDRDRDAGPELAEPLRQQRGRDPAADDQDVGLVAGHVF
jgi:hypothetical protein